MLSQNFSARHEITWKIIANSGDELSSVCCRHLLHRCVQAVIDCGTKLSSLLADSYQQSLQSFNSVPAAPAASDHLIGLGFSLGNGLILSCNIVTLHLTFVQTVLDLAVLSVECGRQKVLSAGECHRQS